MPKYEETKLERVLNTIREIPYNSSASGNMIVQRERNELKYNLLDAIIEGLIEQGIPEELIHRTSDGYIFEMQNYEHGYIPVQIDIKIKNFDYELEGGIEDWRQRVEEQRIKEEKRKAKAK